MLNDIWNQAYVALISAMGLGFMCVLVKKYREGRSRGSLTDEETKESLANPIAITLILMASLLYTAFFSSFRPIIPFPLDLITIAWYGAFLAAFAAVCHKEYKRYTGPAIETKDEEDLSLKYELIRKLTHIVIILVVVCYTVFGPVFMLFTNYLVSLVPGLSAGLNVDPLYYGQYTVVFLTVIAFLGLSTSELVRVFAYKAYPLKGVKAIFRRKEIGASLGSHISLAAGCLAVILVYGPYHPDIVMASISISAIGDGAASIVGKRFGIHPYRTAFSKKRKTLEGLCTATIVSFVISFLFLIYRFGPFSFLLAFVATGVMVFIDWLSLQVSDNILNPIATSSAMVLVSYLLGFA